jgi:hypothetical protein
MVKPGQPLTEEQRAFYRLNRQVFRGENCAGHFMTLKALRLAVISRQADDWEVVDIDIDTGETKLICPWRAVGLDRPDTSEAPRQLH